MAHTKKDAWAFVKVTVGRVVLYTKPQPYKNSMSFTEHMHFTVEVSDTVSVHLHLTPVPDVFFS